MEHTKEPWKLDEDGWCDEAEVWGNQPRIVACVNACARIPTEVLEAAKDGAALIDLVQSAAELKQQRDHLESENAKQAEMLNKVIEQRDELLAALETAINRLDDMLIGDDGQAWKEAEKVMPKLRAVIVKVKE